MKRRKLPVIDSTHILLGKLYPKLVELKNSEEHGSHGELNLFYRGFRIIFEGEGVHEVHGFIPPNKKSGPNSLEDLLWDIHTRHRDAGIDNDGWQR